MIEGKLGIFVGSKQNALKANEKGTHQKTLGMLLNAKTMDLIALGFFSPPPLLHGFGLSYSGNQLLLGIFKSNLLIR